MAYLFWFVVLITVAIVFIYISIEFDKELGTKKNGVATVYSLSYTPKHTDVRCDVSLKWEVRVKTNDGISSKFCISEARYVTLHKGDTVKVEYAVGKFTGNVYLLGLEDE